MHWFDSKGPTPLFIWDYGTPAFYSIPDVRGDGVKVALHHAGEITTTDRIRRDVSPEEIEEVRARLRETLPELAEGYRRSVTCLYTNTPDEHFAIGLLRPNLVVASPCLATASSSRR